MRMCLRLKAREIRACVKQNKTKHNTHTNCGLLQVFRFVERPNVSFSDLQFNTVNLKTDIYFWFHWLQKTLAKINFAPTCHL